MPFSSEIKRRLIAICGQDWVKDDAVTLYSYRCDGLTLHPAIPRGVVFPANTAELAAVAKLLHEHEIPFLPRGAGTGLSGGAIPEQRSVVVEMCRFRGIGQVDPINRTVWVEAGVVNVDISKAAAPMYLHFAPDPSSQQACTIGGNVGENSGGPHTLKYGVTVNHVLGLEVVLPNGEVVQLGGESWGVPGPDLVGVMIGSEGVFGIVSKVLCRLTPLAEETATLLAVFPSVRKACEAVSGVIRAGVIPAALEMIDQVVIQAVEKNTRAGFPLDAQALLIVELEDLSAGMVEAVEQVCALLRDHGCSQLRRAADEQERALIWRARKGAFGAIGQISPSFYTQDGVIPRSKLPDVLDRVLAIGKKHGLTIANVFHAGDGNLHPLILYNSLDPVQIKATHEAGGEILQICLEMGGSLSGEHGIGLEKAHMIDQVYNQADLAEMMRVRAAFNPKGLLNPGKIFPTPGRCSELKVVRHKSGIAV